VYRLEVLQRMLVGAELIGDSQVEAAGVEYDSRKVQPGQLFVCIPGLKSDGHEYAAQAVVRGAVAVVVEKRLYNCTVPQIIVPSGRKALATLAAYFVGRPATDMTVVGITGTNGKTTSSYFCEAVLKGIQKDCGLIGTIQAVVAGETRSISNTTPESLLLHQLLADMKAAGQDSVVMEVSSHSLDLDRVHELPFDVAVFTNLTHDHLDYHGSMEAYFQAKARLFTGLQYRKGRKAPYAVINLDDFYGEQLVELIKVPYITYGFHPKAHLRASQLQASTDGTQFVVSSPLGEFPVTLSMAGNFNVSNALAAIGVGIALKGDIAQIISAVETVNRVNGRFEMIRESQDFSVVVDYAHTPDGLENVLRSAREISSGKVITVFGCGGDRDRAKRPIMGEIASRCSDVVIVTSDNPRSEDPLAIIAEIEPGLRKDQCQWESEVDRASAIFRAVHLAEPGDIVVIAGKGHETYQIVGDQVHAFDDREVARKALRGRYFRSVKNKRTQSAVWTDRRRLSASSEYPAIVVNEG
jgi:UDP-N-acetylmuramoyl-L-alanyl-D-glutamate--2,6-diaminopimelate ligase